MNQKLNITRLASFLIVITLLVYLLIIGKFFLQPICFGIFFMFIMKPLCDKFEELVKYRVLAIILSFIITIIPIGGIIWVFWIQAASIFRNLDSLGQRLQVALTDAVNYVSQYIPISREEIIQQITDNINTIINSSITIITTGLNSSTYIIATILLALLYTFFLLYYRSSIKEFIIVQSESFRQSKTRETLGEIQEVIMKYCYGMLIVIGILAVLNSTGLYIIGISYPIFWGLLAACLAIIPFIGTTIGGFLPFIYAIATTGTIWQPVAVVIMYATIQQIEGNFITPNVVGSSIKINPMVAIMAMILGGSLWGLSGLILALPATAIVRLLMDKIAPLKTVSLLMSSGLAHRASEFREKYNKDEYRIPSMFKFYDKEEE